MVNNRLNHRISLFLAKGGNSGKLILIISVKGKTCVNISGSKKELRALQASLRDSISAHDREQWSERACRHASDLLVSCQARSMLVYVPFRSELDTRPLIAWAWEHGIDVMVPRSLRENRMMELYLLRSWDELIQGAYGIPEPDPERAEKCPVDAALDVIWVPGLAFDLKGGRLGYGGGYFDRLRDRVLSGAATGIKPPLWIGLCYETQVIDFVPMECHDLRLNGLITESGYIKTGY